MEEKFFTKGFQFEKYINERLLEISDEGERRALKEVMRATLLPFYTHAEEAYAELEKRFVQTQEPKKERYEIITGVQRRREIDITEEALVPMRYEDMNEPLIDVYAMSESLQRNKAYTVMRIFIQLEYAKLRRIESEKRSFRGTIYTADSEYPATVQLVKNRSYLKQITDLYQVFESNGVEWNTVCAPYLGKYFDVQIVSTECPTDEEIIKISVDFQEYQNHVIYDLVPMWNVRFMEERTGAYPDFALDRIHYEHCIFKGRFTANRDYLVDGGANKLWNVFRQDGDMHIICDEENPVKWRLVEMGYDSLEKNYDMPVFRNCYGNTWGKRCIHTIAEVKRYIAGLGYESYLQLLEVTYTDKKAEQAHIYSVDGFIEDEIRVSGNRPYMIFKFRPADKEYFLNQDIMSYLVSKIQWQLPEFKCVGELE